MVYMTVLFASGPVAVAAQSISALSGLIQQFVDEGSIVVVTDNLEDVQERFGPVELSNPEFVAAVVTAAELDERKAGQ